MSLGGSQFEPAAPLCLGEFLPASTEFTIRLTRRLPDALFAPHMNRTSALLLLTSLVACGGDVEVPFGPPRSVAREKRPLIWGASTRNRLGVRELAAPRDPQRGVSAPTIEAATPAGWEELPAKPARFRNAVWRVAGEPDSDCYLTLGVGGGAAFNVQRWYEQFGRADAPSVGELPEVPFAGARGYLVELQGSMSGKSAWAAMIAFSFEGQQVTSLKFTGPDRVVQSQRGAFLALAGSLRLSSASGGAGSAVTSGAGADVEVDPSQPLPPDHVPVGDAGPAPFEAEAPADWSARAGSRRALHHTFGEQSELYVSELGGDLRQTLDIWRFELELEAMSDAEFEALPRALFLGDDAVLMDISGDWRGMTGQQIADARVLVAARRDGDTITFCKLVGPSVEVSAQRDAFVRFCGTVRRR